MCEETTSEDSEEFLRQQYSLVRSEIETRIAARRRLLAAGLAFSTAIIGYAFTSGSTPTSNIWLSAILPVVIFYLLFEMLRIERIVRESSRYLQDIEEHFLKNPKKFGWENNYTSYADSEAGFKKSIFIGVMMSYIGVSAFGWYSWQFAPSLFDPISQGLLAGVYVLLGTGLVMLFVFLG